jgi:hypothetical protein
MPTLLLWVQLILPLIVLVWPSVMPITSKVLFGLHIVMAVMIIASIGMLAPWAMPPFWVPWVYGFLAVAIPLFRKGWHLTNQPNSLGYMVIFITTLALVGLSVFGGIQSVAAVRGHAAPSGDTVDLALPFREGRFIVENGGATLAVNGHMHTANPDDPLHLTAYGQSYGIDLIAIDTWGFRSSGFWPAEPERYVSYGIDLIAPCDGTIIELEDGVPDEVVPKVNPGSPAGNYVLIRCDTVDVLMAHMIEGSIAVETDQVVAVGDLIGKLGNSGNSTEPHLHIHAERPNRVAGQPDSTPVWITFAGEFYARNDILRVQ